MARWFYQEKYKIAIYLYDRSQHHGNHNFSHFHVKCLNKECVFNILGNLMEGECDKEKEISDLIKRNKVHINISLERLANGLEIYEVNDIVE